MILNLKFGDSGAYVQLLQLALRRAGTILSVDGFFGENTLSALEAFQLGNDLRASGIVDATTRDALEAYLRGYITVRVRGGDTYYSLARRYATSVSAIRRANPDIDPLNLTEGTTITVPLGFDVVATDVQYTYYYLSLIMDGLSKRYPICSVESIGESVQGKAMYSARVGTGQMPLMYNASHHANEWITTPLVLKFLEDYLLAIYNGENISDVDARQLYFKTKLYIVPMVNADGVDLVAGVTQGRALEGAKEIAMQYAEIPFPSGWKANIRGVDLNLNYPAQWERAKEIKYAQGFTGPAPRDYVGPSPLSEPESIAMEEFTIANNFLLTISYHTQGEVIYWRFDEYLPPRSLEIGEAFASVSGYGLENTPIASGAAGYKDWYIQTYNRPGYTVEVGRGQNPLPLSQFAQIYQNNIGIMALGMYLL